MDGAAALRGMDVTRLSMVETMTTDHTGFMGWGSETDGKKILQSPDQLSPFFLLGNIPLAVRYIPLSSCWSPW